MLEGSERRVLALILAVGIVGQFGGSIPPAGEPGMASPSLTPHPPILIEGNSDVTAENGLIGGSGTAADPYRIEGWEINASSANGIEIRNVTVPLTIRNVLVHSGWRYTWPSYYHEGIILRDVSGVRVEDVRLRSVANGVRLESSTDVHLKAVHAAGQNGAANMFVAASSRVQITESRFFSIGISASSAVAVVRSVISNSVQVSDSGDVLFAGNALNDSGILLEHTIRATIFDNRFASGGVGILGDSLAEFDSHTIPANNTVGGRPILYYKDCSGVSVDAIVAAQVLVANCSNVSVTNLRINGARSAIQLSYVNGATIRENQISNTTAGIRLIRSSNATIAHNTLWRAGYVGLEASSTVRVYQNDFMGSGAFDLGGTGNTWDDGYPRGGNYWSNYRGDDDCSGPGQDVCPGPDGIGDTPVAISEASGDRYPLFRSGFGNASELQVEVLTDKETYAPAESVTILISLKNPTARPISITFPGCEAAFAIEGIGGAERYNLTKHVACAGWSREWTFLPGESRTYEFTWPQIEDSGSRVRVPNMYLAHGFVHSAEREFQGSFRFAIRSGFPESSSKDLIGARMVHLSFLISREAVGR